jgi:riboflavin kinase / FMN adenylyltransferase
VLGVRVTSTVVHGQARGRLLGFPTANLELDADLGLAPGVYAGVALGRPAAVNVGVRPTFEVDAPANVEVHIIGFDGDLYGQELTVELLAWIRAERRFDGIDELVGQLRHDVATARALVGARAERLALR